MAKNQNIKKQYCNKFSKNFRNGPHQKNLKKKRNLEFPESASQPPREAMAISDREEVTKNTQGGSGCGWRRVEGKINGFSFG